MPPHSSLTEIWEDQADFNLNFFPRPHTFDEKSRQTKEFVLCMMSELDELLRATKWKTHRQLNVQPNTDQVRNELTDLLKYLISLCIVWRVTPEEAIQDYWRKSMVCRQRYSEEFIQSMKEPMVIVDIDGVLADYYVGFLQWVKEIYPSLSEKCDHWIQKSGSGRAWLDAAHLGVDEQRWQEIKHQFRICRGKLFIPLYPGAKDFLNRIKNDGHKIVLLTSRPIDQYPNIYTDTLEWLRKHELPFDFVWWAKDKGEKILEKGVRSLVQYVVDDDMSYAFQMAKLGLKVYYVTQNDDSRGAMPKNVRWVGSLEELMEVEYGHH